MSASAPEIILIPSNDNSERLSQGPQKTKQSQKPQPAKPRRIRTTKEDGGHRPGPVKSAPRGGSVKYDGLPIERLKQLLRAHQQPYGGGKSACVARLEALDEKYRKVGSRQVQLHDAQEGTHSDFRPPPPIPLSQVFGRATSQHAGDEPMFLDDLSMPAAPSDIQVDPALRLVKPSKIPPVTAQEPSPHSYHALTDREFALVQLADRQAAHPQQTYTFPINNATLQSYAMTFHNLGLRINGLPDQVRMLWSRAHTILQAGPFPTDPVVPRINQLAFDILEDIKSQDSRRMNVFERYIRAGGILDDPLDVTSIATLTAIISLRVHDSYTADASGALSEMVIMWHAVEDFAMSVATMVRTVGSMLDWLQHLADAHQYESYSIQRERIAATFQHVIDMQNVASRPLVRPEMAEQPENGPTSKGSKGSKGARDSRKSNKSNSSNKSNRPNKDINMDDFINWSPEIHRD